MKEYAILGYLDEESTQAIYEAKEYLYTSNLSDYILTSPIAHLTFCDFTKTNDIAQLKSYLRTLSKLKLENIKLDSFDHSSILFLAPEKTKLLTQIHSDLFKMIESVAVSSHYDILHWYPHITIANRILKEHYQTCMDYCNQTLILNDVVIDKICIVEFDIVDSKIQSQKIIHTTYLK